MNDAKNRTCAKGQHRWTLDSGRRCAICGTKRTRMPTPRPGHWPQLIRLEYEREGGVWCTLCKEPLKQGDLVAWWRVAVGRRTRPSVYCATCHWANIRRGKALR